MERVCVMPPNLQNLFQRRLAVATDPATRFGKIGLAVAVGIAYFLAAQLSLALLTKAEGVAVFWPAAGVSAGVLIALGPRARISVAVGAIAATILANLLGDRNIWSTIFFAVCNAGEALLAAWLIEHFFGPGFRAAQCTGIGGGGVPSDRCLGDWRGP